MKKKLIVLSVIMILALTGCHSHYKDNDNSQVPNRFVVIDEEEDSLNMYSVTAYDKNTGVIYMFNSYGPGHTMCPLYNTDGTIMVYDGWDKTY